jgi:hypothetical protein
VDVVQGIGQHAEARPVVLMYPSGDDRLVGLCGRE